MKFRLFALILILALSLVGWAQEPPAAPNSTPAPQAKGCCHHNMAGKDDKGCCHHAAADAKNAAACCSKDKCEMKDGKCCAEGKSCGEAKGDKTAMGCCGSKCERHPHTPAES